MNAAALSRAARDVYRVATDREVTVLAAAFAYYAFVSIVPTVVLALVVSSIVGGEAIAAALVEGAGDAMPAVGVALIEEALTAESGRAQATIIALVVAVWGALKVFRGLSMSFDRIYGTDAEKSFTGHFVDGIVALVAVAGGFAAMIGVGLFLGFAAAYVPFGNLLGLVGLLASLTLVFLPIYYVMPPVDVSIREVLPGVLFAAVGWTALQIGFQFYASRAGQYEGYGAVGGILLLLTWLYLAGIVILLGAVVNVVWAEAVAVTEEGAVERVA
ncbi:ribonuclease BN [Halovivax asiaticus JCM 14624]|uniref:Ribonuclease BN n=1 Tax=Halovivax asiaticus JCM 14624 TaxID=1227490 RepID=M0BD73_9EURY|nr:YihY/virulence factor BrkB family protein [Halovivax asiaticus]ELZ08427.1 ribonuclease BN [Halovivax asiaticus JCM 14624]